MIYFGTLFDRNYLSRALVLFDSLKENCPEFTFFALCLDDTAFECIKKEQLIHAEIIPIHIRDLELQDEDLRKSRLNRTIIEYYFTISPCLALYLIQKFNLPHICTLDADLLFYSNPTFIFKEIENYSVIITPHKFSPEIIHGEKYGRFNVSFQIFKNDDSGLACLRKWRTQCINWCKDVYDDQTGFFADQKYLDGWPELLGKKLLVLNDPQTGIAVWNVNRFKIEKRLNIFYSNGHPLVFYHFHGFKVLSSSFAANEFLVYKVKKTKTLLFLYQYYWGRLKVRQAGFDCSTRVNLPKNLFLKIVNARAVFFHSELVGLFCYIKIPNFLKRIFFINK